MDAKTRAIFREIMREIGAKGGKIGGKRSLETMTAEEPAERLARERAAKTDELVCGRQGLRVTFHSASGFYD